MKKTIFLPDGGNETVNESFRNNKQAAVLVTIESNTCRAAGRRGSLLFALLAEAIFKPAVNCVSKATVSRPGIPAEANRCWRPHGYFGGPLTGPITLWGLADK